MTGRRVRVRFFISIGHLGAHCPIVVALNTLLLKVVYYQGGEIFKNFCDTIARLGRRLEESEPMFLSQRLSPFALDLFVLVRHIRFISDEHFLHSRLSVGIDLLEPVLDVIEGSHLCDIVHEQYAHGAFVIRLGDCTESLLTRGVPNLELDLLVEDFYGLDSEVDADRRHV